MANTNNKNSFRFRLQGELLARCRSNSSYSLRAFAKLLEVSPSALSAMLRGKRRITKKSAEKMGLKLGMGLEEIKALQLDGSGGKTVLYDQLSLDTYALISDWYHYAILELLRVRPFKSDAAWIAKKIGITKTEVNIAVERLVRIELLEIDEEGQWHDISGGLTTNISEGLTSAASRKLQKQILEMAIQSIDIHDLSKRDNTSLTIALHSDDLLEVKQRIKNFRRSLLDFLERPESKSPNEVYHVSFALNPITNSDPIITKNDHTTEEKKCNVSY
ncbi:MAG: TIGR02147 family protein [Bacteriovoracaceae bacterium]|nr:TIGR02147 family protein [Bacteriovoracaceae bacterium]